MATRTNGAPEFPLGNSPLLHVFFVALWAIWAALTVHEYVGDGLGMPAFLLALLLGVLFGIALFALFTRTEGGGKAKQLYDDAPLGQRIGITVVLLAPLLAFAYGLSTVGVSTVLFQVAFISAVVGHHQAKFASAYAHLQ